MIDYRSNMNSYTRGIFSDIQARERMLLEGPRDADGRPMPSAFARACEAKRQLETLVGHHPNVVILSPTRRLG